MIATFVAVVLAVLAAILVLSLVLAHFGIVVLLCIGLVVLGRSVRRHGV